MMRLVQQVQPSRGIGMRHPDRSRFSGGGRDLPWTSKLGKGLARATVLAAEGRLILAKVGEL